ncbi:unnamed protein product [Phytomonas sp. EM1]|nr:unnamed protein product [Phytomonas sp. EM1]|eukprot:CCW61777.1 unnamed protein product [Phytomonas sp. isolate EM1]
MHRKRTSVYKRQRSESNSPLPRNGPSAYPPSMVTPCRPINLDLLTALTPCAAYSARSVSVCTGGTEGLSDDSVFVLDIRGGQGLNYKHQQSNDSCSADFSNYIDPEATQWQRELNEFFDRLDQRPLHLVP